MELFGMLDELSIQVLYRRQFAAGLRDACFAFVSLPVQAASTDTQKQQTHQAQWTTRYVSSLSNLLGSGIPHFALCSFANTNVVVDATVRCFVGIFTVGPGGQPCRVAGPGEFEEVSSG